MARGHDHIHAVLMLRAIALSLLISWHSILQLEFNPNMAGETQAKAGPHHARTKAGLPPRGRVKHRLCLTQAARQPAAYAPDTFTCSQNIDSHKQGQHTLRFQVIGHHAIVRVALTIGQKCMAEESPSSTMLC